MILIYTILEGRMFPAVTQCSLPGGNLTGLFTWSPDPGGDNRAALLEPCLFLEPQQHPKKRRDTALECP